MASIPPKLLKWIWRMFALLAIATVVMMIAALIMAFASGRPADLGLAADGRLAPCPESLNCVSSDVDADDNHHIEPLPAVDWARVVDAVRSLPRTTIIEQRDDYLHAECRSTVFRFVDDLELHRRDDHIAVRSAARIGHSDFGVNRARVEQLREILAVSNRTASTPAGLIAGD